ncbi:TetR family transcriptional regulator [Actinokineospora spheciospongiae]|nr:TetR family transcriptional regulator [Actinokineospora spheciospongiae]
METNGHCGGMTAEPGLRARKKAATRLALGHAAWSLMLERGLDAVTPESVAEAVGVSSRTFRNYFGSREEAIVDEWSRRHASLADAVRARPADEPVWDSLVAVLPRALTDIVGERADFAVLLRVISESPAMLAQNLLALDRTGQLLAEVIAERTGADADRDLAPRLLAGSVLAAVSTAATFWVTGGARTDLPDLLRECLDHLRAGLPTADLAPTA